MFVCDVNSYIRIMIFIFYHFVPFNPPLILVLFLSFISSFFSFHCFYFNFNFNFIFILFFAPWFQCVLFFSHLVCNSILYVSFFVVFCRFVVSVLCLHVISLLFLSPSPLWLNINVLSVYVDVLLLARE